MNTKPFIVSSARGDVTGDKISDYVFLTGTKTADSPFVQNITLTIRDGRTGRISITPLKVNVGYNPTLILRDFTGDKINDILISINSGGSGGMTFNYIYTAINDVRKLIFDFENFNQKYKYTVNFLDNYKVEVNRIPNNSKYLIDISLKDKDYLNEIYDSNGKLISPIEGFVNPIGGAYPIDYNSDGVYDLYLFQKVAGRYNADSLGYLQTTLKWDTNSFKLYNQTLGIFGY